MLAAIVLAAVSVTDVMFCFDTEDFTSDYPNDAIVDQAKLMTEEGVVAHFQVVGYLAQRLQHYGRRDVIEALKPHIIGSQTLYHSLHPIVGEYTDIEDAYEAERLALQEEAQSIGMLRSVFDRDHIDILCPPGNNFSYAAMYAAADLGERFFFGGGFWGLIDGEPRGHCGIVATRGDGRGFWYCGIYQLSYLYWNTFYVERMLPPNPEPDYKQVLDKLAPLGFVALYMHPHNAVVTESWDLVNFPGKNLYPFGAWKPSAKRDPKDTQEFYRRLRKLVRAIKADGRFRLTDVREYAARFKARQPITRREIPAIRQALQRKFGHVDAPGSWCVADVFQAAVKLLKGEDSFTPGRVRGFLDRPVGVKVPTTVTAADLRAAAKTLDRPGYLPTEILVGNQKIGPADFLMAALDVLATGAETAKIEPREQLGSFDEIAPLTKLSLPEGWSIYAESFKDRYLSDRLRLQLWTLRFE